MDIFNRLQKIASENVANAKAAKAANCTDQNGAGLAQLAGLALATSKTPKIDSCKQTPGVDIEAAYEMFCERAAIAEFDGKLPREDAERLAFQIVLRNFVLN